MHDQFRLDMETSIQQKDSLIGSFEDKIANLRKQTEQEISKQSALREEHLNMKLTHNNMVTELTHNLRRAAQDLDELKHQH